ncbi:MAG: hypothetical protein AABO58_20915 [Acidobacteriota bacterium]
MSWQLVLHDAWATKVHFGEQLVYTFGPYGFAYAGYDPRTFVAALAAWLVVAAAFTAGILEVARDSISSAYGAAAFVVCIAAITAMQFGAIQVANNVPFVVLPAILVRLHAVRPGRWAEHVVAFALALGALVKFSFFTAAVGVIVVLGIADVVRRRVPFFAVTFFASIAALWLVARQPLAILPLYVRNSIEVASGYGEGMSVTYPLFGTPFLGDRLELAAFVVIAAAFLLLTARHAWPEAAAMLAVMFVAFKIGFMRQDGHDADAAAVLALAVYIALPARLRRGGVRDRVAWVALALAATQLFSWALTSRTLPDLHRQAVSAVTTPAEAFAHLVAHGTDRLERRRADVLASLHARLRRRPEGSSFDVYPSASAVLIAWQLPAARRPVFQACCASTEPLLEMNAAHLRSSRAPATILFDVDPLDKRFPTLDDSVSWPEILRWYERVADDGAFQILRRRAVPIDLLVRERTMITARFGERFVVPDSKGDLLFARFDLRYTAAGRLMRIAYITPPLAATVTVMGEKPRRFRVLPANARAGFLLSPLVRTGDDFGRLSGAGREALPRVMSVTFEPARFPWMFEPRIAASFERVSYQ